MITLPGVGEPLTLESVPSLSRRTSPYLEQPLATGSAHPTSKGERPPLALNS